MANRHPSELRRRKVLRVGDGKVSPLAALFADVPLFYDKLPQIIAHRGRIRVQRAERAGVKEASYGALEVDEILHWLSALRECSPTTYLFVTGIIADFYSGTRHEFKPATDGNQSLTDGLQMLSWVELEQPEAKKRGLPSAIEDLVASARFKKAFPRVGGRTREHGHITEGTAVKQIRAAKVHREATRKE